MTGSRLAATIASLAALGLPASAIAAPGDLVTGFGSGGQARIDVGGGRDSGAAVVVQSDGRIVLGGTTNSGANAENFAVVRLGTNGVPDGTFGSGGRVILDFGGAEEGHSVALAPDGKVVVGGRIGGGGQTAPRNFAVARLLDDGSPDQSFGLAIAGRRVPDFGGDDDGEAVAVGPDGRIVAAGTSIVVDDNSVASRMVVTRMLAANGGPDPSFGSSGLFTSDDTGAAAHAVAVQPDGKVVIAGQRGGPTAQVFLIRRQLEADGAPDPAFNANGGGARHAVQFSDKPLDVARALAIRADGRIVVAGETNSGLNPPNFGVLRLDPDGHLDRPFGIASIVSADFGAIEQGHAMALAPDGKIVVVGDTSAGPSPPNIAVLRLTASGSVDTGFGQNGLRIVDFGAAEFGRGVAIAPDGSIVVAGTTATGETIADIAVALLEGDALPPSPSPGAPAASAGEAPAGGGFTSPPTGAPARCGGRKVTRFGSERADRITGTKRRDVIATLGGNDLVHGLGGSDVICAGAGKDRVFGDAGDDVLRGGDGGDTISGGSGADSARGDAGADSVSGGTGADRLYGDAGIDRLNGGPGADQLFGGLARDVLSGGPGRDRLLGGPGLDRQRQ